MGRRPANDLFAEALRKIHETGHVSLYVETEHGARTPEDLSWYLTSYRSFPGYEKKALKFARGRVLDVGCGAGRHSLYLQRRGFSVTAIDKSELIADLARKRGVKDVRVVDACGQLPFRVRQFDTILLFGNNLGICGTLPKFRQMLKELHRISSNRGRILGSTRARTLPGVGSRLTTLKSIPNSSASSKVRLRLALGERRGPWFNFLLFSPTELQEQASLAGWELAHIFSDGSLEPGYSVVMEKLY